MIRILARSVAVASLLFAHVAFAAEIAVPEIAANSVPGDSFPERKVTFPHGVSALADIPFATLDGYRPMVLDLYRPEAGKAPLPLVVFVHGGGWELGHTRQAGAFVHWPDVLASIAARGYAVASIEYRLSKEAIFPAAIQDVKAGILYLRANAAHYGIDPKRAVIMGGSAGGQLAALAGTTCGVAALEPLSAAMPKASGGIDDCVQGVVAWYGVFDFMTISKQSGTTDEAAAGSAGGRYLGCTASGCGEARTSASPQHYIDANDPPTLLLHGVKDTVVPVQQSRDYLAALKAKGVSAELLEIPGVDHSFVGPDLETTKAASLQAINKTVEFIDRILGGPTQK